MVERLVKYNPAFLSEEELKKSFVVRHVDLELILQSVKENIEAKANQHVLVIGARGMGKTMLVLRAAAEIRATKELADTWYPLVLGEESYEACSPGEFWLQAVFHLGKQTQDEKWSGVYKELRAVSDEARLREMALASLMDFADDERKRILLIAENLNMVLGEQMSNDDAWVLRHTLINEPRIMVLGTATSRFEEIENSDRAMYELFRIHDLKHLDAGESKTMWNAITGRNATDESIRPIQILTGGNPRLLAVISNFSSQSSFRELMEDLTQLIDDHTGYFKSHLDGLPASERKVFVSLLDLWDPATAREVAKAARIEVSKASSFLHRLIEKGAATVAREERGKKWYQVSERMYNVYYLLRRRGHPTDRVRATVDFMIHFYPADLACTIASIAREACALPAGERADHFEAYESVVNEAQSPYVLLSVLLSTPVEFFRLADFPRRILGATFPAVKGVLGRSINFGQYSIFVLHSALSSEKRLTETKVLEELASAVKNLAVVMKIGGELNEEPGRIEEAERQYRKAIETDPGIIEAWAGLSSCLLFRGLPHEAEQVLREAVTLNPSSVGLLYFLGYFWQFGLQNHEKAEETYFKAMELAPREPLLVFLLIDLYARDMNRPEAALKAAQDFVEHCGGSPISLNTMAWAVLKADLAGYLPQAESWSREAVEKAPENIYFRYTLASILGVSGKWPEALDLIPAFLAQPEEAKKIMKEIIGFFVDAAASAHGAEALSKLEHSKSVPVLEPLAVALKIFAGEKVNVAQEILEVASDVVARMRKRQEELQKNKN